MSRFRLKLGTELADPEPEPLQLFGAAAGATIWDMLMARRVELVTGARPLDARDGRLKNRSGWRELAHAG